MLVSPFAFFRGGAYLMAADLADGPRTGLHAQLCGDAHLSNFGIFAAPDRRLVFSINDFDETLPGPFEWDVKRLAASFAVAGRDRGFDDAARRSVVTAAVREYREAMARFAEMRNIHVWYARLDVAAIREQLGAGVSGKQMKRFQSNVAKRAHEGQHASAREAVPHRRRRAADRRRSSARHADRGRAAGCGAGPPRGRRAAHDPHVPAHAAARPARTCSRATATCMPPARSSASAASAPAPGSCSWWAATTPIRCSSSSRRRRRRCSSRSSGRAGSRQHGQRVVEGQRMMQAAPDVLLGWERIITIDGEERDFYIRQLWDSKGSAEVELMDPAGLEAYGENLRLDARESPRALGRQDRDRRLSRQRRRLRPRHGVVRRDVRGPERAGLPRTAGGGGVRPRRGRDGRLTPPQPRLGSRTVETCCAASSITSRSGCSSLQSLPAIVGLVLLLVWLIRRLVPAVREGFDAEVSSQMLGVVAALFGLLLAFIVVIAYQNYGDTQSNVSDEADALAAIVRDSGAFPQPDRDRVRGCRRCVCARRRRR